MNCCSGLTCQWTGVNSYCKPPAGNPIPTPTPTSVCQTVTKPNLPKKESPQNGACLKNQQVVLTLVDSKGSSCYPLDVFFKVTNLDNKQVVVEEWAKGLFKIAGEKKSIGKSFTHGNYQWQVSVRDPIGRLSEYDSSPFTFSIDKIGPAFKDAYALNISYSSFPQSLDIWWWPAQDLGCGGLHALAPYQVEVALDAGFSDICATSYRAGTTYATGSGCYPSPAKPTVYARVRARDRFDNWSGWQIAQYTLK